MTTPIAAIAKALDESIASVAETEYLRLREVIVDDAAWRRAVASSIADLEQLTRNQSPEYDASVLPVLYLIRYQFSHTNMAWSMLADSFADHRTIAKILPRGSTSLQVVDLGAGTGAMLFGTVAALSTMREGHADVQRIHFTSLEPATAMHVLGLDLWDHFVSTINDESRPDFGVLHRVREVASHVDHTAIDVNDLSRIDRIEASPRWLTALHILYSDERQNQSVKSAIDALIAQLQPSAAFMTFQPRHQERARAVLPGNPMPRNVKPLPVVSDNSFRLSATNQLAVEMEYLRRGNPRARQAYVEWNTPRSKMEMLRWMPQGRVST